jgi:hypothetical protein
MLFFYPTLTKRMDAAIKIKKQLPKNLRTRRANICSVPHRLILQKCWNVMGLLDKHLVVGELVSYTMVDFFV